MWPKGQFEAWFTRVFLLLDWLSYYQPIAGGRKVGFTPSLCVLALCEMQTVLPRIWTRVAVSIYSDRNITPWTPLTLVYVSTYGTPFPREGSFPNFLPHLLHQEIFLNIWNTSVRSKSKLPFSVLTQTSAKFISEIPPAPKKEKIEFYHPNWIFHRLTIKSRRKHRFSLDHPS